MKNTSAFITNEKNKKLKSRIVELIQNSKELRFLVGFFYFSGIKELYKALKDNPNLQINVLVGLSVDKTIHGLVEYSDNTKQLTDREKFEKFLKSVSRSINTDDFDTSDFYEQVKFFLNLIKQNKLIIRKTYNPNHAKFYIFKIKDELKTLKKSIFITGSSNLTRAGLFSQDEFNVEISDYGNAEAGEFFDTLWEKAVKITEVSSFKQKLIELIEKKTLVVEITPFEAFALVLKTYIDLQDQKQLKASIQELLIKAGYKPYKYQLDAVTQALTIIENYNGVVISDVVGLGKSVVASMIAKSLGKRGMIICPPGIKGDEDKKSGWQKYKEDFKLYDWDIRSCGFENLKKTLKFIRENEEYEVIIIDEVHRFRNQDTEAYEILNNICRNKIVILLTATPFNNTPADIFSLLKFFVIPGKSKITLSNDLNNRFKKYSRTFKKLSNIKKNYKSSNEKKKERAILDYELLFESEDIDLKKVKQRAKYLSDSIKQDIEPVLIRRNRLDLKKDPEYSKEIYELSEIDERSPHELFFELSEEQLKFYEQVTTVYFGEEGKFTGAIYQPFAYETGAEINETNLEENRELLIQSNLYDFMRRLLVKRFESSFGAFKQSIENFKNVTEKVQQFIKNSDHKFILDRKLMNKIYTSDIDEIEEELKKFEEKLGEGNYPKSYKIYEVDNFRRKKKFLKDIESDKQLFEKILTQLNSLDLVNNDPKLEKLIKKTTAILNADRKLNEPQRKVVIFTEYTDTAKYLKDRLEKAFPDKLISGWGNLTKNKINEILENFDASYEAQKNQYQILLATDKLSEGFNLNRAGAVINYDIPWNPTRVIQRVGRLNRISKKVFDKIQIYNFFPTAQGAQYVRSREIASEKMFLIHNALGEDTKIFELDEEPTAANLYKKFVKNPEADEEESFQTKIRLRYSEIEKSEPEVIKRISTLPSRVKVAKKFKKDNLVVFIKKGLGFFVRAVLDKTQVIEEPSFEKTIDLIECEKKEKPIPLSFAFWENYQNLKELRDSLAIPASEQSLERKAINNLTTLITNPLPEWQNFLPFIRDLREDILEYKTLCPATLRKIAKLKTLQPTKEDLKKIKQELSKIQNDLGTNFLEKVKNKTGKLENEVIVAIENIKQ